MASKIKKYMEEWRAKDEMLLNYSGGNAKVLQNREYLKLKHRETRAFLKTVNRKQLSKEDKAWLAILRSGNKHLEKQLYPNRFVRYTRRAFNFIGNALRVRRTEQPAVSFSAFPGKTVPKAAPTIKAKKETVKATIKPLKRLTSANKYAAVENLSVSKGLKR